MARYRTIDVRMWGDEKFRALSPLLPSGRALWIYLLTGPDTTAIPGAYRAGEAGLAEGLGWPAKAFREAFREVFREGLVKADWKARFIWIPKAVVYNQPQSPNVVKSWRSSWDELPECDLKDEAYSVLKAFLEGIGEAFGEAFAKACRKPSRKLPVPVPDPVPDLQERGVGETPSVLPRANGQMRLGEVPLPDWLPVESWDAFAEVRKKLRAPLTDRARALTIRQLEKLREAGHDPVKVLEQSVQRGWRGVFEIRDDGNKSAVQAAADRRSEQIRRVAATLPESLPARRM